MHQATHRPVWGPSLRPEASDVVQGALRDCGLMATLSQAARRYPSFLRDRLDDSNEVIKVGYFASDGRSSHVSVDRSLLVCRSWAHVLAPFGAAAKGSANAPIWPALFEQAFARTYLQEGSYRSIENISSRHALSWLTGLPTQYVSLRETWASKSPAPKSSGAFQALEAASAAEELVVLHIGGHAFELTNVCRNPDVLVARTGSLSRQGGLFARTYSFGSDLSLRIPAARVEEMVGAYAFTQGAKQGLAPSPKGDLGPPRNCIA